ncbi:MAG: hypothetical protein OXR66_01800 [Candidatus Woesearchaeota archaeon]|nr:hypothetical protein [Candidatus Woesearchaeota archaeon]
MLGREGENKVIRGGIIFFWWGFWLCSFVDLLLEFGAWQEQFGSYFSTLGVDAPVFAGMAIIMVACVQFIAFSFASIALLQFFLKDGLSTHRYLFSAMFLSLCLFSLFTFGDVLLGHREELFRHSIYWLLVVLSWFVYTSSERELTKLVSRTLDK